MKTEQNQNIRGFLIFTLLLTLLIGLCLPAAFDVAAQVGVDARPSKETPKSVPKVPPKSKKPPPATKPAVKLPTRNKAIENLMNSFAQIPAGEFLMGSENGDDDEKPVHRVRISRSFEMGKYEVTQEQWQAVMGNNPSHFKGANLPVENVSWNDAQEFIKKLNGRNDGYTYRLPTEAEWEYACRAGTTGDYAGNVDEMAWYFENSGNKTHPVGEKKANAWGLYDMHGNVWEWCSDYYASRYYGKSPDADPKGPNSGKSRVLRGGSWDNGAQYCRSANRFINTPDPLSHILGFPPGFRFRDYGGFRLLRTYP